MQDLHDDLAALLVHGARHLAVIRHVAEEIQGAAERQQPALAVRRDAARDDQPDATACPFAVKGGQLAIMIEPVFQARMHGSHDDAVAQRGKTQVERGQQMGIGSHGRSDRGWYAGRTVTSIAGQRSDFL